MEEVYIIHSADKYYVIAEDKDWGYGVYKKINNEVEDGYMVFDFSTDEEFPTYLTASSFKEVVEIINHIEHDKETTKSRKLAEQRMHERNELTKRIHADRKQAIAELTQKRSEQNEKKLR